MSTNKPSIGSLVLEPHITFEMICNISFTVAGAQSINHGECPLVASSMHFHPSFLALEFVQYTLYCFPYWS